jgi:hypothetical protein
VLSRYEQAQLRPLWCRYIQVQRSTDLCKVDMFR